MDDVHIRRVGVETIIDLRHRVLRPGLPPETAHFEGDDELDTHHLAAYLSSAGMDRPVGCATFMLRMFDQIPAWQLRGMATDPLYRGRGVASHILNSARIQLVGSEFQYARVTLLWCNARAAAISFYRQNGWEQASKPFTIEGVGVHMVMTRVF